ncbi:hypothetical protein ACFE04_016828 [Oxalis oulophora]
MTAVHKLVPCLFTFLVSFSGLVSFGNCTVKHTPDGTILEGPFLPAGATWYGDPNGAGSTGGACGYTGDVEKPPFTKMIAAGGKSLFKGGKGCGACYEVKCTSDSHQACSGHALRVVITDECPGGPCSSEAVHFDLSGSAFGALAIPGKAAELRNAGVLKIQHRQINCDYPGINLSFHVDSGSSPYYFAMFVEYANKDGEIGGMELKAGGDPQWQPMQQSWGAIWKLNPAKPLKAPFSLRLHALETGEFIVVNNAIPTGWQPGKIYQSIAKF